MITTERGTCIKPVQTGKFTAKQIYDCLTCDGDEVRAMFTCPFPMYGANHNPNLNQSMIAYRKVNTLNAAIKILRAFLENDELFIEFEVFWKLNIGEKDIILPRLITNGNKILRVITFDVSFQ